MIVDPDTCVRLPELSATKRGLLEQRLGVEHAEVIADVRAEGLLAPELAEGRPRIAAPQGLDRRPIPCLGIGAEWRRSVRSITSVWRFACRGGWTAWLWKSRWLQSSRDTSRCGPAMSA